MGDWGLQLDGTCQRQWATNRAACSHPAPHAARTGTEAQSPRALSELAGGKR